MQRHKFKVVTDGIEMGWILWLIQSIAMEFSGMSWVTNTERYKYRTPRNVLSYSQRRLSHNQGILRHILRYNAEWSVIRVPESTPSSKSLDKIVVGEFTLGPGHFTLEENTPFYSGSKLGAEVARLA